MNTYQKLVQDWEKSKNLPVQKRIKAIRTLGFEAVTLFFDEQKALTANQLLCLIKILGDMISIQTFGNNYAAIRNKMMAKYIEKSNVTKPQVLLKCSILRASTFGTVYIGDVSINVDVSRDEKELVDSMNRHEAFYFNTDDEEIELRVIECPEPILSLKEFKKVVASTFEPGTIHCPTGELLLNDSNNLFEGKVIRVEPGFYKIAAYIIKQRLKYSCIIVAVKTQAPFELKTKFDNLRDYA